MLGSVIHIRQVLSTSFFLYKNKKTPRFNPGRLSFSYQSFKKTSWPALLFRSLSRLQIRSERGCFVKGAGCKSLCMCFRG